MGAYTKQYGHKGAGGAGNAPRYGNFCTFATSNVAQAIGTLRASPFYLPTSGFLRNIGMNIQGAGGAGNLCQIGIYNNASDSSLYPTTVVAGAQTLQNDGTVTGYIETAIAAGAVYLDAGLYWSVFWSGAGTLATMVCTALTAVDPILGLNASQVGIVGITATLAFVSGTGAMPAYPAGGTYLTTALPMVSLQLQNS